MRSLRLSLAHPTTTIPISADFDGDGITDYAIYDSSTGHYLIHYSQSNSDSLETAFGAPGWFFVLGYNF